MLHGDHSPVVTTITGKLDYISLLSIQLHYRRADLFCLDQFKLFVMNGKKIRWRNIYISEQQDKCEMTV